MGRDSLQHWQRPRGQRPFVLGHRGVTTRAPENTLGAFDAAIQAGADGVELDVRLAKDGAVVVIHDATLARITGGSHTDRVDALSLGELQAVPLPGGQRLSPLDEILGWSVRHQCRVNIELKHEGGDPTLLVLGVVESVRSAGSPRQLLFSSFDLATVFELAQRLDDHVVAWLTEGVLDEDTLQNVGARGIPAIHPKHLLLTPETLGTLRQRFSLVNTWTVNDPTRVGELARLGVDTIITDDPAGALRVLAESRAG